MKPPKDVLEVMEDAGYLWPCATLDGRSLDKGAAAPPTTPDT